MVFHLSFLLIGALFFSYCFTQSSLKTPMITIRVFKGPKARAYFKEIAYMRINLFKEYPYLYEGTMDYEREYLETYFKCDESSIVLAFDGQRVVGFSNCIPLIHEEKEIQLPFIQAGYDLNQLLYMGEVMIYPEYRGKGIVRRFFEIHEAHAVQNGFNTLTFMTVNRPLNHPYKPECYVPLDGLWNHFGYQKAEQMQIHMAWTQVDTHRETENTLSVWHKHI